MKVKLLNKDAKVPQRGNEFAAGLDIYATQDVFIPVGTTTTIPTGIAVELPNGFVGKIEDRSSMGLKGLRTGAGVVDSDYRGELKIVMHNLTNKQEYDPVLHNRGYQVHKGDKVAQILVYPVSMVNAVQVEELTPSERNFGSFGSTGR